MRTLEERRELRDDMSAIEAIRQAALAVQRPILFSLLIIIAAYIPLLTLERVERRLFTPMALTVCFALLGSLLLCLTLVPVLATVVIRSRRQIKENQLLDLIIWPYEAIIRITVRYAWLTVFVAGGVVCGSIYLGTRLGT